MELPQFDVFEEPVPPTLDRPCLGHILQPPAGRPAMPASVALGREETERRIRIYAERAARKLPLFVPGVLE